MYATEISVSQIRLKVGRMKKTPFYDKLSEAGARFTEFAGYEMPIQFEMGIIFEHKAVRENVGLFDVSHMGEILLEGNTALDTVQNICTNDMSGMEFGRARYSLVTNEKGGIVDDILVYHVSENRYLLVVNAGNCEKMVNWVKGHLLPGTEMKDISAQTAQLALQGKKAAAMLETIFSPEVIPQKRYTFTVTNLFGEEIILSRTGYTGEDGFEIYCPVSVAERVFDLLMEKGMPFGIELCGLGARDTLRLEAGMPLYGHEMSEDTLADELELDYFIKMNKEFCGKAYLGNPKYKRIGLKIKDRGIAREQNPVYYEGRKIGFVTSGTHSPTLGYPVAMARVEKDFNASEVKVEVRGKFLSAEVVALPFNKRNK